MENHNFVHIAALFIQLSITVVPTEYFFISFLKVRLSAK
jgi:hypothetical protein